MKSLLQCLGNYFLPFVQKFSLLFTEIKTQTYIKIPSAEIEVKEKNLEILEDL